MWRQSASSSIRPLVERFLRYRDVVLIENSCGRWRRMETFPLESVHNRTADRSVDHTRNLPSFLSSVRYPKDPKPSLPFR